MKDCQHLRLADITSLAQKQSAPHTTIHNKVIKTGVRSSATHSFPTLPAVVLPAGGMLIFSSVGVATPGGTGVLAPLRSSSLWSVGAVKSAKSFTSFLSWRLCVWMTARLPRHLDGACPKCRQVSRGPYSQACVPKSLLWRRFADMLCPPASLRLSGRIAKTGLKVAAGRRKLVKKSTTESAGESGLSGHLGRQRYQGTDVIGPWARSHGPGSQESC